MELQIGFGFNNSEKSAPSREYKGKSLLEIHDNYVVVDLETTGLDPNYNSIIEIISENVFYEMISECET